MRKYFPGEVPKEAFDDKMMALMKKALNAVYITKYDHLKNFGLCVGGSIFWARPEELGIEVMLAGNSAIEGPIAWSTGSTEKLALEHAMERWIPTWLLVRGRRVAEIPPAPKVMCLYFPQYHQFEENDRFWGTGFTEWTLLRKTDPLAQSIMHPLTGSKGGLGWYNLENLRVRQYQEQLAKAHGVHGFVYYHYWFSGENAPVHHKVMYKVLEAMLEDGKPDMPFMLSWANEPWTREWGGNESGSVLLPQTYDPSDWKEHFEYLCRFFDHPNYMRHNGAPVLALYRIGHMRAILKPMLALWRQLAKARGLSGLYVINTLGNFVFSDPDAFDTTSLDGAFHFWPQLRSSFNVGREECTSTGDYPILNSTNIPQYWGSYAGFDRRPRVPDSDTYKVGPKSFKKGLEKSFSKMAETSRSLVPNLFFHTAWNEWNEQAILEPDTSSGFGKLEALREALEKMPIHLLPNRETGFDLLHSGVNIYGKSAQQPKKAAAAVEGSAVQPGPTDALIADLIAKVGRLTVPSIELTSSNWKTGHEAEVASGGQSTGQTSKYASGQSSGSGYASGQSSSSSRSTAQRAHAVAGILPATRANAAYNTPKSTAFALSQGDRAESAIRANAAYDAPKSTAFALSKDDRAELEYLRSKFVTERADRWQAQINAGLF